MSARKKHPGIRHARKLQHDGVLVQVATGEAAEYFNGGDRIVGVDGEPLEDLLDLRFKSSFSERPRLLVVADGGEEREITVPVNLLESEELQFEQMAFRTCGNDCIFCFIHQMPTGLRDELYLLDEDYRFGFLYGNYVTMSLVRDKEIERIIRQRLSPVYLSVHSTDMELRNRMLGLKRSRDVLATINRLCAGGIDIHCQIVLVPGWNDGAALSRTMSDLSEHFASPGEGGICSVGVVPVGLSRHREGLTPLKGFSPDGCGRALDRIEGLRTDFMADRGRRYLHAADEFYLRSHRELPPWDHYENFPLEDNGIGMSRLFVDEVLGEIEGWREPAEPVRVALLTGLLGDQLIREHLVEPLGELPGLELELIPIENSLFGEEITVSGLLPGRDLLGGLERISPRCNLVAIPPNTLNADQLFLDNLSLAEFRERCPVPLCVPESGLLAAIGDAGNSGK